MENETGEKIDRIVELLPSLSSDELDFIKGQISVMIYNREIRKKQAESKEIPERSASSQGNEPDGQKATVHFEQLKNGKFFNLCIGNEKIFMDYREITGLLKIAMAAGTAGEAIPRLYNWMKKERKDILVDGHITNASHPVLPLVYRELLETFEVG